MKAEALWVLVSAKERVMAEVEVEVEGVAAALVVAAARQSVRQQTDERTN